MSGFEAIGVDTIPEERRTSTPWTFCAIVIGGNFSLGLVVYGWVAITLGLGFWSSVTSLVIGVTIALPFIAPLILIGSRTATNNSTASGAHFGVRGRLVGSFVGLFISAIFTAIAVWTGGAVGAAALDRLFGIPDTPFVRGVSYTVLTVAVSAIVIYGYHLVVRFETMLLVLGGVALLLMVVAFAPGIDVGYPGGDYGGVGFWSAWITSLVAVGAAGPLSYVTYLGDWTRYISPARYPARRLLPIALAGVWVSQVLPALLGILVATAFVDPTGDFATGMAQDGPFWFTVVLLPFVVLGSTGLACQSMYSAGLDLDAIVPRLSRATATAVTSAFSLGLVLVGSLVLRAEESLSAIAVMLVAVAMPWAVVTGIGFLRCRGRYSVDDLQVFNRRQQGGRYWFTKGWNLRAVTAWLAGSVVGVLGTSTTLFVGPVAELFGGLDLSFVQSGVVAGLVYLGLLALFPERPAAPQTTAAR
ncbi:MAG: purine-cytosine permease family protein [Kineosporiaceae bacterium]